VSDHYVYIIATKRDGLLDKPVKVGITSNWRSRLKTFQTASVEELAFAWVFNLPEEWVARSLEQSFHFVMRKHRLRGEWFDIDPISDVRLMCANIRVALEVNLPDWSEEDRDFAYELTRAPEAEAWIATLAADPDNPQ
jgi:hypothetical protein